MNFLDNINKYLEFAVNKSVAGQLDEENFLPCITVSRMPGCRGNVIAHRTADKMNIQSGSNKWHVYNKSLVSKILEKNKWPPDYKKYLETHKYNSITDAIEEALGLHPSMDLLQKKCNETITSLAEMGHVILVGRGSNFLLSGRKNTVHIRITGSLDSRIQKIQKKLQLTVKEVRIYLKEQDAFREKFIRTWFNKDINDPLNYTCAINTDEYTEDQVSDIIIMALSSACKPV